MLRTIFLKTLRDQRRGLLGWAIALITLTWIEAALWPTVGNMPDLDDLLANYPEGMKKLFNLDAMTTGQGFMNAELFSLLLPALFVVYGIGRGARLVAGEEEAGSLDLLLVTPLSRARVLAEKTAAMVSCIILLGVVLMTAIMSSSLVFDVGIGPWSAMVGSLAMVLLGVEYGCLTIAIGAATGRRSEAVAVGGVAAVGAYVLYVASQFIEGLGPTRAWSPVDQAISAGPLGGGLEPGFAWMLFGAALCILLALPVFRRRDVGVSR